MAVFDIDKDQLPDTLQYDVCIIGSGPAGCAVAHTLAGASARICVVESGRRTAERVTDSLREVECTDYQVRLTSRERVLGGTSSTWSGLSGLFDSIDFERRGWVPHSGWPISLSELWPYYSKAAEQFRFPGLNRFEQRDWIDGGVSETFLSSFPSCSPKVFVAAKPEQRFGAEFADIYNGRHCDLVLGCTILSLAGDSSGVAKCAQGRTLRGQHLSIRATFFVLAVGGIETSRLLLNSRYACESGLGNDRDQVGRFFMDHPKASVGVIKLKNPIYHLPALFGFLHLDYALSGFVGLQASVQKQRECGVLNSYCRFEPLYEWSDNPGVHALTYYLKRRQAWYEAWARRRKHALIEMKDYSETGDDSPYIPDRLRIRDHLWLCRNIARNVGVSSKYLRHRIKWGESEPVTSIRLRNFMEMSPVESNRVVLGTKRDALGMPLPRIECRISDLDKHTVRNLHRLIAEDVSRSRIGHLDSPLLSEACDPWPISQDASHHMGGARMGTDRSSSVTDKNCRLHSAPNVFVSGSATFPTGGCVNPTFSIVALAIRLGEHIKKVCSA